MQSSHRSPQTAVSQDARNVNGGYSALLRVPHVPFLVSSSVLARLPLGSSVMLVVLLVSTTYGAAMAGTATALMAGAMTVSAPLLGKLIDLGKAPVSLMVLGLVQSVSIFFLVVAAQSRAPAAAVLVLALLAGAAAPPVAGTTRSLWPSTVPSNVLSAAYDLEVLIVDVMYVAGPLLASVMLSVWNAGTVLSAIYAGLACGCFMLAFSTPVRDYSKRVHEVVKSRGRSLLTQPAIVLLLLNCLCAGAFSGWIETAVPLYYSQLGRTGMSGLAISLWSIGSIVGIVAFTHMHPRSMSTPKQLTVFNALYALVCLALVLPMSATALVVVLFFVGVSVSPTTSLQYRLAGLLSAQERQGEMFSWINTAMAAGIAVGSYLAGLITDIFGTSALFAPPVVFIVLAVVCVCPLCWHSPRLQA